MSAHSTFNVKILTMLNPKGQLIIDNPETQATLDIRYRTETHKTKNTTQKTLKDEQHIVNNYIYSNSDLDL
jgi:hypothetical protein